MFLLDFKKMLSLKKRSPEKEIMDLEMRGYEETAEAYRFIRGVNRYLFGTRVILSHLREYSRRWDRGALIRILDVASGASDIPQAITLWAQKNGFRVQVTALDINPQAMAFAKSQTSGRPGILFVQGSVFNLPFLPESFDYVISSMFFHHLADEEAVCVLKIFDRFARRGILVNDLTRNLRAYLWIHLFARLSKNEMIRNDAPLSVLRGYKKIEAEKLIQNSGLSYLRYHRHWAHRFAIAGEKHAG